jgi:hypothetical protein
MARSESIASAACRSFEWIVAILNEKAHLMSKPARVTDEMYARIPSLLEEGMTSAEIAELYGVKPGSLQVLCCKRGISLRSAKNSAPPEPLSLPLSHRTRRSLRGIARALGRTSSQLASDLLERIASDNLYRAVLDEEAVTS